jgi:hypothetical protein
MPTTLRAAFPDLRFSAPSDLYFTDEEYRAIASDFWRRGPPGALSDRDRAFIQAALFVAVDKSEQAGMLFEIYRAFISAAPSKSVHKLLKKLAISGAKQKFSKYIDDTPKYSAVGRSAIQYSAFSTQWRIRLGLSDDQELDSFLR